MTKLILLMAVFALTACGKESATVSEIKASDAWQGTWRTACRQYVASSFRDEITFHGDFMSFSYKHFTDPNCTTLQDDAVGDYSVTISDTDVDDVKLFYSGRAYFKMKRTDSTTVLRSDPFETDQITQPTVEWQTYLKVN